MGAQTIAGVFVYIILIPTSGQFLHTPDCEEGSVYYLVAVFKIGGNLEVELG